MGIIFIFFIWYCLIGQNNPRIYRTVSDKLGKIILAVFLLSLFGSAIPGFLIGSLVVVAMLGVGLGLPVFIVTSILRSLGIISRSEKRSINRECDRAMYEREERERKDKNSKRKRGSSLTGLTKSYPKRRRIVEKFSKKYSLNLTEKEVDRIVEASYMSYSWEREIYDMSKEYDAISEWYNRDTNWLRAYLHAFPIQSVSSDFHRQREICIDVFRQVFTDINPGKYATIDECVDAINNKYLTAFDETTFMIAYRFLQANKIHFDLPSNSVIKGGSELDRLMSKYDEEAERSINVTENTYRQRQRI